MRDITTKINDTAPAASGYLDASEFNSTQGELENAVTSAPGGQVLDPTSGPDSNLFMLAQSLTRHGAGGAAHCTATGSATTHALVLANVQVRAPTMLFKGLTCRYAPPAANAGNAVSVNAFGLGLKPLVDHNSAPLASTELDGRVVEIFYDPSIGSGSWVLPAWSNALYVGQTPSSPPSISSGEGWAVDGDNHGNLNFAGLTGDGSPDSADLFAFLDVSEGHHNSITFAQLLAALGGGGGLVGVQFLTVSGTYTKTVNTSRALVIAVGGGGGGAGAAFGYVGSGGGGGGTSIAFVPIGADPIPYTIGAGGAGGAGNANGAAGGATIFDTVSPKASASGGAGGQSAYIGEASGAAGGVGTVGLVKIAGGASGPSSDIGAGSGGSSFLGGGGAGANVPTGSSANGGAGGAYGGGGGGANASSGSSTGGAGAPGCILVVEFA